MKVGDLVKYNCGRGGYTSTIIGLIIKRVPDTDPEYFAWDVNGPGGTQAVHESFLEVISENR